MTHCNIDYSNIELEEKTKFPMLDDDKVYLDSASTTFTPQIVIDSVNDYITHYQSNYNRGSNDLVFNTTTKVNNVRTQVASLINAEPNEIIFTSGATASSNLIINKIAINTLSNGDEVLLCKLDHSSTIQPWLNLKNTLAKFNVNIIIKDINIDPWGDYNEDDLIDKVSPNTKFVILTHIHNIYGLEMGIEDLSRRIKEKSPNTKIVLDASQSIGHIDVNVKNLNVDYLYFSGHKMFATTGIGVLYIKGQNYSLFEEGTPNIVGIISLGSAILDNISAFPSRIATSCSKCAAGILSFVLIVQPSLSWIMSRLPKVIIGSIAMTMPSDNFVPEPRLP